MGGGLLTPATPQEASEIELLNAMMGGTLDPVHALRVLRKHNNNLDKAATALLEGDTGEGESNPYADLPNLEPLDTPTVGPRTPPPSRPEKPVIDLTKDDDDGELARALQASLEDQPPAFGPSNRAPDPNWAMAEVTGPVGMSQDEQAMSRAIEASLTFNVTEDLYEELPLEERIRKGDTPVALRPTASGVSYAALLLHALFFVPQVRNAIASWLPRPEQGSEESSIAEITPPTNGPGWPVWTMLELFANMDLARLSELSVDAALNAFAVEPWNNPADRPGDSTFRFYEGLVYAVEHCLKYNNLRNPERKPCSMGRTTPNPTISTQTILCCVKVSVGMNPEVNDLVSALAAELAPDPAKLPFAKRQVIMTPSDVIAFQLLRDVAPPPYDAAVGRRTERALFKYPKTVYLDQFMKESYDFANEKRTAQRRLIQEIKELEHKKKNLLYHNEKDTLADLQSALHYYENVAESDSESKRAEEIRINQEKLKHIIETVKAEVTSIDATISRLKSDSEGMLDCPELQEHRYDLRAVIVHDGLYGRSHLYSYVKSKGKWWKTVDYVVTEVPEETVLSDPTGLHLGAGPYFLLYSRAMPQAEEDARAPWHESLKDAIKYNNQIFFEQLPPEVASQVVDPNSPPSSPRVGAAPSEQTINEPDTADLSEARGEPMDTTD
ncbi:hypothetical protein BN946_scf184910.g9 [Trametes cinnabarina]|uniref:USP domain-containing protein n=1 Tax=Pycnoporus cinnabarinus TaxID=5643 RepID=A0A060SAX5_PYCCI|nr:hypothetical protein BN946_scf184910.g9 [Trametes cinnabarina]